MKLTALGLTGIAVAICAIPAAAHHSFAMFDAGKRITVAGTVKEFQWTNPHSFILMAVANSDGQVDQWSIEMGGPAGLAPQGWGPQTLRARLNISLIMPPLREGQRGHVPGG